MKGAASSASWLADIGMQFDVGPLFLEAVGFFDVHGVGTTRDDVDEPAHVPLVAVDPRGVRVGLGIPF